MTAHNSIKIKSPKEIELLREAGKRLASIIKELKRSLTNGITTQEINLRAERLMVQHGVKPAFKGYRGFPASVCVSVNQEVVHGIPGKRIIRDGDIVSLDVGIIYKDYFSDTAATVGVGQISPELQRLIAVTEQSLQQGILQARIGSHLSDISFAIQNFVEANNFSVVRDFVGHGIGRALHEEPEIPNFGPPHCGPLLEEGMVLAIEPMVNLGTWKTNVLADGWTVVTADQKSSAHFEHTVAITPRGPEILTK
ncbi:MAG: type I methionyl aminopeptidase [Candidatus Omnitrophota bacterium]